MDVAVTTGLRLASTDHHSVCASGEWMNRQRDRWLLGTDETGVGRSTSLTFTHFPRLWLNAIRKPRPVPIGAASLLFGFRQDVSDPLGADVFTDCFMVKISASVIPPSSLCRSVLRLPPEHRSCLSERPQASVGVVQGHRVAGSLVPSVFSLPASHVSRG